MAFGNSTVSSFGTAAGDILSGIGNDMADNIKAAGYDAEAANYGLAAKFAGENVQFTQESTAIQEAALQRNFEMAQGKTQAEIAGAGFTNSGSAQDIMRENAQQGAIAQGTAAVQGSITELGYQEQQQSYETMQSAATAAANSERSLGKFSEISGYVTAAISAASGITSLFTPKG